MIALIPVSIEVVATITATPVVPIAVAAIAVAIIATAASLHLRRLAEVMLDHVAKDAGRTRLLLVRFWGDPHHVD